MINKANLLLFDQTLTIDRPIADVFEYVSNHENYANWYPGVVSVETANDGAPASKGKAYNEVIRMPTGRNRPIRIEVIEANPPNLFMTEGAFSPLHPRMEFHLTPFSTTATLLNLVFFSRNQSSLGRLTVKTLFGGALKKRSETGLRRLKSILEETA